MYLERLLQINMATLAALGALLLGMGQRSEGPPLLVMLAAAVSVWLTDVTGKFRLGRWTANVLMLVGAVVSLHDVYPPRNEAQTVGLSWFLIYLQIILLFQQKDQWKYWLLIMLSLLEVVLATLFSQGVWFGVLLAIYMLLGFSAMTLLMLYRQWEYYRKESGARGDGLTPDEPPPLARFSSSESLAAAARWPLSAARPEFASLPGGSSHAGVGRNLVGQVARMGLQTMVLTCVVFFAIPRFGQVSWRRPIAQPNAPALVGFTDEVQLGELGSIIESRESVLRVQFFQGKDGAVSQQLSGDIYLQGAYLMTYRGGRWAAGQASCDTVGESPLQRERRLPWGEIVRQKIRIDPLDRNELFFVTPYMAIYDAYVDVNLDHPSQRLVRNADDRSREFNYVLATTAIVGGEQLPLTPAARNDLPKETLGVPDDLPNLRRLAAEWIKDSDLPAADVRGRAKRLEKMLAGSGLFQYSLAGAERNRQIDPIEDFLTEHRQGHCEYFATALTLMLRSQGIPARMVSGFKIDSDAWNSAGGYYQVRQLHAHTWVEAYLSPRQLPDDKKHAKDYWAWPDRRTRPDSQRCWEEGGWLRLDPTPGGFGGERQTWFTPVRNGFDWLQGAWSRYVVELDYKTQCEAIYQPIADAARGLWRSAIRSSFWEASEYVSVALYLDHLSREVKWTLLGLIAVAHVLIVVGIGVLLFRIGRRLWARCTGSQPRRRRGRRVEIEFYRRFEHLLARQGLVRAVAQTQREFAAAAGVHLARQTGDNRLATLPALVADAFYRVRFGLAPLDNLQAQAVEQALAEIAAISKNRASGKSRPSVAGA